MKFGVAFLSVLFVCISFASAQWGREPFGFRPHRPEESGNRWWNSDRRDHFDRYPGPHGPPRGPPGPPGPPPPSAQPGLTESGEPLRCFCYPSSSPPDGFPKNPPPPTTNPSPTTEPTTPEQTTETTETTESETKDPMDTTTAASM